MNYPSNNDEMKQFLLEHKLELLDFHTAMCPKYPRYNPAHADLAEKILKKFYDGPFSSAFPDPTERDSFEVMKQMAVQSKNGLPRRFLTAIGTHLQDPAQADVQMFMRSQICGGVGCFDYIMNRRNSPVKSDLIRGYHVRLLQQTALDQNISDFCIVFESNDPALTDPHLDSMPPMKRINLIIHKWGVVPINLGRSYVQPSTNGGSPNYTLGLFEYPIQGRTGLSAQQCKNFLTALYDSAGISLEKIAKTDPAAAKMQHYLNEMLDGLRPVHVDPIQFLLETETLCVKNIKFKSK